MMKKLTHIVLMVDASRAYGRGICRGVAAYAERREDWLILPHERPELQEWPKAFRRTRVDGIIAYIPNLRLYYQIARLGVPTVDVHGRCRGVKIPVIESDARAMVSLAVEFFLRAGFAELAFCGYPSVFFSDQRQEAFRQEMARLGKRAHVYAPASTKSAGEDLYQFEKGAVARESALTAWLRELPKPVAVLACNDICGQQVMYACREAGMRMPEEVSVLGIDNDEIICRLCRPTLSSIEPDVERIGVLAAELVAAQLEGKTVEQSFQVAPRGVVERGSTDAVVAGDPSVVKAARLIRDANLAQVSVEGICEGMALSRSTLDRLFVEHLGRSIAGEISRVRLQRSQNLLRYSELPLARIATQCGFGSATYFCRFFKRLTGVTPDAYRQG
jgi:LacI family transcriptional regulator